MGRGGEGGGEHASERTSRCVSEHAQPTTHASAFHGAAQVVGQTTGFLGFFGFGGRFGVLSPMIGSSNKSTPCQRRADPNHSRLRRVSTEIIIEPVAG